MKSKRSKAFRKMFEALPDIVQRQANAAYKRFKENPSHPGLNLEQVSAKGPVFSVRVGIHYRALLYGELIIGFGSGLDRMTTMRNC